MLHITKRVDYALIALCHLALHRGERFSARELAESYSLSQPLMANVLKAMARESLIRSVRGTKGGYELTLSPERLPVGRVVEVLEGSFQLAGCIGATPASLGCSVSRVCPVKHSVFKIHLQIRDVLFGHSIADLVRGAELPGDSLPVAQSTAAVACGPTPRSDS